MSQRVRWFRSRVLSHAALVALLAGTVAGCADATRIGSPFTTGSTSGARAGISAGQPMPPAVVGADGAPVGGNDVAYLSPAPTTGVSRADLPPAGGTGYGPGSQMAASGANSRGAGTSQTVTLGPSETLFTLSQRYGVPVSDIIQANNFTDASKVAAGTRVIIPGRTNGSPSASTRVAAAGPTNLGTIPARADGSLAVATPASGPKEHVVKAGESLEGIAKIYGLKLPQLMAANGIDASHPMKVGQRLKIPAATVITAAAAPTVGPTTAAATAVQSAPNAAGPGKGAADPAPTGTVKANGAPAGDPPGKVASAAGDTHPVQVADTIEAPSSDGQQFRWPVKGRIISNFGTKPNGERNDGINMSVPDGTSIKAAEAGTVIYSGNEIAGYGNLILIRHAGGWVTAYAHNSDMLVKRGDTVKRGQIISKAGMSGSVTAPQLHFELRRGSNPVNPLDYLSQTG